MENRILLKNSIFGTWYDKYEASHHINVKTPISHLGIVQLSGVSATRYKGSNIEAVVLQEYWHRGNEDGAQDDSHDRNE